MDYNAINAKIKAMSGFLLTRGEYEALSRLNSVEEVGAKLREDPAYDRLISQLEGTRLRRSVIEHRILMPLAYDYVKISRFISDYNIRKYLEAYYLKIEINVLKLLMCMVYDERDISYSFTELDELFDKRLHIDSQKLIKSANIQEFISNLKGTEFYSVLNDVYRDGVSLFDLEMQLDLYYYTHLRKLQKRYLSNKDRLVMERINGTEADLRNIIWIQRLKTFYTVPDQKIYAYLIPAGHKLDASAVKAMIEAKTAEELSLAVGSTAYGDYFAANTSPYKMLSQVYTQERIMNPDSIAMTAGYLYFKELELSNIVSLLEGVRYALKPAEILKYLNIPDKRGEV